MKGGEHGGRTSDLDDYVDAALSAGAAGLQLRSVAAPQLLDPVRRWLTRHRP